MNEIFRTTVNPLSHQGLIAHGRPGLMLGSCFSDNVGEQLARDLFDVTVNPFGTLYNPASIAQCVDQMSHPVSFTKSDLVCHEGRWHSMSHHSSFSADTAEECLDNVNRSLREGHALMQELGWCVVTLGSAWVFVRDGEIVANCHKLPSSEFRRILMSVDDAVECLGHIVETLPEGIPVVFTVSPIRHRGDGAHGNQISKSTLLLAIDRICQAYPSRAIYFPSYEIMMDDLRDYRFYASDMRHPSEVAVDYIYSIFKESFFTPATMSLSEECRRLWQRLSHRPLTGSGSKQAMLHRLSTIELARKMASDHPELQRPISKLIAQ